MKNLALLVAGIIFAFFAVMHLIRLFVNFDVTIGGHVIAYDASFFAFIVATILAIWMFWAMKKK